MKTRATSIKSIRWWHKFSVAYLWCLFYYTTFYSIRSIGVLKAMINLFIFDHPPSFPKKHNAQRFANIITRW